MSIFDVYLNGACLHTRQIFQHLLDGVAFPSLTDTKTFNVYSHEGDYLGDISTHDLEHVISLMKRMGRPIGKCTGPDGSSHKPGFTLAWSGWYEINGQRI